MLALLAAWGEATAADQPKAAALAPVEIKLPKPLFQGTPKNIKPSLDAGEIQREAPAAVRGAREGVTNLALKKKVTSSDMAPIIGELELVTDGDKEGADGSFVELGPGKQWVQIDLGAGRHLRDRRLALPRRRPRLSRRDRASVRRPRLHRGREDGLQQRLRQLVGPGRWARTWSTSTTTAAS